jgi:hypothetical protein
MDCSRNTHMMMRDRLLMTLHLAQVLFRFLMDDFDPSGFMRKVGILGLTPGIATKVIDNWFYILQIVSIKTTLYLLHVMPDVHRLPCWCQRLVVVVDYVSPTYSQTTHAT